MTAAELRQVALGALTVVRARINWKPGKDIEHLRRRVTRGHLPEDATLQDYERVIRAVIEDPQAAVYCYERSGAVYPCVVSAVDERTWLVMTSEAGIMETAFVLDVEDYVERRGMVVLGTVREIAP